MATTLQYQYGGGGGTGHAEPAWCVRKPVPILPPLWSGLVPACVCALSHVRSHKVYPARTGTPVFYSMSELHTQDCGFVANAKVSGRYRSCVSSCHGPCHRGFWIGCGPRLNRATWWHTMTPGYPILGKPQCSCTVSGACLLVHAGYP